MGWERGRKRVIVEWRRGKKGLRRNEERVRKGVGKGIKKGVKRRWKELRRGYNETGEGCVELYVRHCG